MSKPKPHYPDELYIEICNLWFREKLGVSEIKEKINQRYDFKRKIKREEVYALLKEARDRKFIRISPPEHNDLSWRLMEKYGDFIKVVSAGEIATSEGLAARAAELIIEKIRELGQKPRAAARSGATDKSNKVHLGIGAGYTTREVASEIATLYDRDKSLPPLEIHALTSGFQSHRAELSPISWFSWFMGGEKERVSFVGLFSPPAVPKKEKTDMYAEIKTLTGIKDAYDKAKDIQIVVTSLGDAQSESHWFPYVKDDSQSKAKLRKKYGWKGDVLYCPYSDNGPIPAEALDYHAVTIFDIPGLVNLARKHMVVLVSGPTHAEGHGRKTRALMPLLENEESLRVWSHLILDVETAREVAKLSGLSSSD